MDPQLAGDRPGDYERAVVRYGWRWDSTSDLVIDSRDVRFLKSSRRASLGPEWVPYRLQGGTI
jgi:hypothetical protein